MTIKYNYDRELRDFDAVDKRVRKFAPLRTAGRGLTYLGGAVFGAGLKAESSLAMTVGGGIAGAGIVTDTVGLALQEGEITDKTLTNLFWGGSRAAIAAFTTVGVISDESGFSRSQALVAGSGAASAALVELGSVLTDECVEPDAGKLKESIIQNPELFMFKRSELEQRLGKKEFENLETEVKRAL